jgi:hypothetical protein
VGRGEEEGGGFTARGEADVEGGGSGRRRGGEGEGNELHGEEDMREGVQRRERKGEAVLGKGAADKRAPPRGWWRRLNRPRRARARGRGGRLGRQVGPKRGEGGG